jgi:hypothetical protein
VFAVVGPLITALATGMGVYVGLATLVFLLLNLCVLEKCESKNRINAAKIQELFDTYLFELQWNNYVVGPKPDLELVADALATIPTTNFADVRDWYPAEVGQIDLPMARLICQRSNVWWDAKLRRLYLNLLLATLSLVIIVMVFFAAVANVTVASLLVGVVFPVIPLIEVMAKQIGDHRECVQHTSGLKEKIDAEIERGFAEEFEDTQQSARVFQDEIWRHRSKCPMVFDWVHKISKERYEDQMQFSARAKVNEYLRRKMGK